MLKLDEYISLYLHTAELFRKRKPRECVRVWAFFQFSPKAWPRTPPMSWAPVSCSYPSAELSVTLSLQILKEWRIPFLALCVNLVDGQCGTLTPVCFCHCSPLVSDTVAILRSSSNEWGNLFTFPLQKWNRCSGTACATVNGVHFKIVASGWRSHYSWSPLFPGSLSCLPFTPHCCLRPVCSDAVRSLCPLYLSVLDHRQLLHYRLKGGISCTV